jgi:hypothetical protein
MYAKDVKEMLKYADIYGLQLAEQQILTAMAEGHSSVSFASLPESTKTSLTNAGYRLVSIFGSNGIEVYWNSVQKDPELHADGAK